MSQSRSLRQAYDLVADLIPDYDWTTAFKSDELIHVPTKLTVSLDMDGYYMFDPTINHTDKLVMMYDYNVGDFVRSTQDPAIAASAFVTEVINRICKQRLEGN